MLTLMRMALLLLLMTRMMIMMMMMMISPPMLMQLVLTVRPVHWLLSGYWHHDRRSPP